MTPAARFLTMLVPAALALLAAWSALPHAAADDPRVSAENELSALELDYLSVARDTTEDGYKAQAKALERIADLRTPGARRKLESFLAMSASKYPRRAILILRALVRNGSRKDLDNAIKWVERQRSPALVMMLHEVISAPTLEDTRLHLRENVLNRVPIRLQVQVVRGLGFLGDEKAIGPLLRVLKRSHSDAQMMRVGVEAMEALGRLKAKNAQPLLQVFLRNKAFEMRDAAARALGLLGDPRSVPALRRVLDDEDPLVVESAALALGLIGAPTAVPDLVAGLEKYQETNLRLVDAFTEALRRISGKAITADAELWRSWWEAVKDKPWMKAAEPIGSVTVEGPTYYGFPVRSSRVVFVLDVSRSMGWNQRLKSAKEEIVTVLRKLPRSTRYGVIVFSDHAAPLQGQELKLREAKRDAIRKTIEAVNKLKPLRGTNTYQALMQAFDAARADTFFLLSDGHPSVGPDYDAQTADPKFILNTVRERNRYRRVRIHAVALLRGDPPRSMASLENRAQSMEFMKELARENAGRFKVIE